jgi:hypothetical protein
MHELVHRHAHQVRGIPSRLTQSAFRKRINSTAHAIKALTHSLLPPPQLRIALVLERTQLHSCFVRSGLQQRVVLLSA